MNLDVQSGGTIDIDGKGYDAGTGPGLSPRRLGDKSGAETVTLTANQLPSHTHAVRALDMPGDSGNPENRHFAASSGTPLAYTNVSPNDDMGSNALSSVGGSQSHNNMMPNLCINFIIALFGVYPSRQ